MAELRRQLQSAQISPPAQPQKITAAVRRVSKPEANIMLLYTLCAIMHESSRLEHTRKRKGEERKRKRGKERTINTCTYSIL